MWQRSIAGCYQNNVAWLYEKLAGMGRDLAGMMIISVNDIPEMREVFQGFEMESVPIRYSLNSNQPTQRRELIITVK